MNITKNEYVKFIKPLVDKTIEVSKKLTQHEFVIAGNTLLEIAKNEFEPDVMLNTLNSTSPLCEEILTKYGVFSLIEDAKQFLNTKKTS